MLTKNNQWLLVLSSIQLEEHSLEVLLLSVDMKVKLIQSCMVRLEVEGFDMDLQVVLSQEVL